MALSRGGSWLFKDCVSPRQRPKSSCLVNPSIPKTLQSQNSNIAPTSALRNYIAQAVKVRESGCTVLLFLHLRFFRIKRIEKPRPTGTPKPVPIFADVLSLGDFTNGEEDREREGKDFGNQNFGG